MAMRPSSSGGLLNGGPPVLALSSVKYSLTDGTSIPPPQPQDSLAVPAAKTSLSGPLSSHPVTPIEGATEAGQPIPDSYNWSRTPSATMGSRSTATTNGVSHVPTTSDDSNNFDPALGAHQPLRDTSRRPSFVERFMPRLRSASFLRNSGSRSSLGKYGESSTSLARQKTWGTSTPRGGSAYDGSAAPSIVDGRGLKRPASPVSGGRPESRGSTFPRMVRKKSVELLSTARRRSGMWSANGNGDGMTASAMEEERERERLRELDDQDENARRIQEIRAQLDKQKPAPMLPDLPEIGSVTGGGSLADQDLFKNIGR